MDVPKNGAKILALHNSTHITAPPSIKARIKSKVFIFFAIVYYRLDIQIEVV
jgi:hypothetical protein